MTDEQIIKALEMCAHWENDKTCEDCPANVFGFGCANKMSKFVLGLINRQTAEIEGLKERISYLEESIDCSRKEYNSLLQKLQQAKSEAIKEFVARLCKGRVENDPVVIATKAELDYVLGVGLEVPE